MANSVNANMHKHLLFSRQRMLRNIHKTCQLWSLYILEPISVCSKLIWGCIMEENRVWQWNSCKLPFSRFPYFMNWSTSAFEAYLIAITVYKVLSFYFVLSKKLFLFLRLTRAWPQILRRMFLFPKGQQVHCVLDLSLFCFSLFLHSWILVLS